MLYVRLLRRGINRILDPYESLTNTYTVITYPVDNLNCSSVAAHDFLT